jgi:hypothetical protein
VVDAMQKSDSGFKFYSKGFWSVFHSSTVSGFFRFPAVTVFVLIFSHDLYVLKN